MILIVVLSFKYIEQLHRYSILCRINHSRECVRGIYIHNFTSDKERSYIQSIILSALNLLIYNVSTLREDIHANLCSAISGLSCWPCLHINAVKQLLHRY